MSVVILHILTTPYLSSIISVLALGPVPPNELGVVLPHEHLFLDFLKGQQPCNYLNESIKDLHLTLGNMGRIRQYPYDFIYLALQLSCC